MMIKLINRLLDYAKQLNLTDNKLQMANHSRSKRHRSIEHLLPLNYMRQRYTYSACYMTINFSLSLSFLWNSCTHIFKTGIKHDITYSLHCSSLYSFCIHCSRKLFFMVDTFKVWPFPNFICDRGYVALYRKWSRNMHSEFVSWLTIGKSYVTYVTFWFTRV